MSLLWQRTFYTIQGFEIFDIADMARSDKGLLMQVRQAFECLSSARVLPPASCASSTEGMHLVPPVIPPSTLPQMDVLWVRRSSALWGPACTGYPVPSHFTHKGQHAEWMP